MRNRDQAATLLRLKLISVAVASCFAAADLALANPTGPTVANGQVTFHQQGNLLQVTNSPNAIINWQSFSIGASEITRFLQQSASSAVLNRVITQNPSSILGVLQSNGRVFLINPNGILFGPGSQVDVAGLVASTLNLSDTDFLAGRLRFTEVPGAGSVINQGAINAASGGQVYLVGPAVKNEGVITSPSGEVILAAGNSVELVNPGTPDLRVEITAPDNEAVNLGQIAADAGRVGIYAGLINQSGTVQANTAQVTEDGRIVLRATKGVNLEAGSVTAASGVKGGNVTVETETGTIKVSGQIDASGSAEGGSINLAVTGENGGIDLSTGLNAGNAAINISGTGHTMTLSGDMVTAGAPIVINDSVILGAPASITLDTTNNGAVAGGANITITGTVDDDVAGSTGLIVTAGTTGTNTVGGAIGGAVPIANLTTNGSETILDGGSVTTTGDQNYNGPVTLGAATALAAIGLGGDITINSSLSGMPHALTINAQGDIAIRSDVSTGPQTISAGEGLTVESSSAGFAQLNASGGQTINARYIEVTAQDNQSAAISNSVTGDQIITVSGGGSSPGIDVQSLASGGSASIGNFAEGAAQTITVTDADHINVNGFGPNFSNVSAIIHAIPGTQTISITGSGANAINVGSAGALGGSIINARSQSITAGASGESGSITIVGPDVDTRFAAILTNAGFAGSQTLFTSGALTITGGNAPNQPNASAIRHNASGPQTVTAASIMLEGGSSGTGNGVDLRSVSEDQTITVTGGGTLSLQGGGGTDNFARIRADAGNQHINVAGGAITITGGDGPDVPFPDNTANNFARIENRTAGGVQTVIADTITLTGGAAGANNFAGLQAANQFITTSGDVTLQGGAGTGSSGARLGGTAGVTATNAVLNVGGNLTLTGGSGAGAVIGSNEDGGLTTDIVVNAAGDITLNPGPGAGARIGSPSINVAGGNISLTSSGGDVVLNGGTSILTQGGVAINTPGTLSLIAGSDPNRSVRIQSGSGQNITAGNIALTGGAGGTGNFADIRQLGGGFDQTITVTGGGTLAMQGGSDGLDNFARIRNDGFNQTINAPGGAIVITGGSGPDVLPNPLATTNNFARIENRGLGIQSVNAHTVAITGGLMGQSNFAGIQAAHQQLATTGDVTLVGGGGDVGGGARIGAVGNLTDTDVVLNVGGSLMLTGGAGSGATIGSSPDGGRTTDIVVAVTGDITTNRGLGSGVRIGSPSGAMAGGTISLTSTGGNIALNSGGGFGTAIRTLDNVVLTANAISQGDESLIRANQLTTTTTAGTSLGGNNQVAVFNASNFFSGDVLFNNTSPLLTVTGVNQTPFGALTLIQDGDLTLTGGVFSGPQSISATGDIMVGPSSPAVVNAFGPQAINAGGGLIVQSSPLGFAQITADGGQTIDAAFVEVIAQGNDASISNFGSGSQVITTTGTNDSGEGLAVRSFGGPGTFARISQGGSGEQVITVLNADQLNVNGIGGFALIGSDSQIISMTGETSANAINLGSSGALGSSQFFGGTQNITAGLAGQSGSITIHGSDAPGQQAIMVSGAGSQVVSTSGALTITGGSSPFGGVPSGFFAQGNGGQHIKASGVTLQGGPTGTGNTATITAFSGVQQVEVEGGNLTLIGGTGDANNIADIRLTGGGVNQAITVSGGGTLLLQGGSSGANNFARIRNDAENQDISVAGGNIVISGGNSTGIPPDTGNNFARIENRSPTGMQTVDAGTITITGGPGGESNFAGIQAAHQMITTTGDVVLTGGGGLVTGARIGAVGSTTPTDLTLNVGGSLSLTGGNSSDATLGANQDGNQPTNIVVTSAGDITLNPGTSPGANVRIGSPEGAVAAGNISLTSTSGEIALNSAPGIGTFIRTLGDVSLTANTITQGADARIQAAQLDTHTTTGASLAGANRIAGFHAVNATSGAVTLNNTSALLTVNGINQVTTEPLTIAQDGDLVLTGTIVSGPQSITATGNISVVPASPAIVQAFGPQTINAGGLLKVKGKDGDTGSYAQVTSTGHQTINAAGLQVAGGSGANFAEISAPQQTISVSNNATVEGGSGGDATARIGGLAGVNPSQTNLALNVGGDFAMFGGAAAAIVGSPSSHLTGGNVSITTGGDISLGSGSAILTAGNVALNAVGAGSDIIQAPGSVIQANELSIASNGTTTLNGTNQVSLLSFPADITLSQVGDFVITTPMKGSGNIAILATGGVIVSDTWIVADDSVSINAASLKLQGLSSGALIWAGDAFDATVTGELRLDSSPFGQGVGGWTAIVAEGDSAKTYGGDPHHSMRAFGVGLLDRIAGHGPVNISAKSVALNGGTKAGSFAAITGGPINITTTGGRYNGDFSLAGGSGLGAFGWVLSSQGVNLNIGGKLRLTSGTGPFSFARIQTVRPTSNIKVYFPNLSSGGYFVNGVKGAYRDGLSGFYAGPAPAKPGKRLVTSYRLD